MAETTLSRRTDLLGLAASLLLCYALMVIAGIATAASVGTWFQTLNQPPFRPPDWLFGPVWFVLYTLMGIAAWRVWRIAGFSGARPALTLYGVQLALNFAWSFLFFGFRMIGLAFAEILVLLALVIATAIAFHRIDGWAALMFVPYIAWVAFASLLNGSLWVLN
ncbi:MAG: TspO/MBR family protein [Hyphomicrobiales bacterium]